MPTMLDHVANLVAELDKLAAAIKANKGHDDPLDDSAVWSTYLALKAHAGSVRVDVIDAKASIAGREILDASSVPLAECLGDDDGELIPIYDALTHGREYSFGGGAVPPVRFRLARTTLDQVAGPF